jgi:hypothetical protein
MRTFKVVAVPFSARGWPVGIYAGCNGRRHPDELVAAVRADGCRNYRQLAKRYGISPWTIKDWLSGRRRATTTVRIKMIRKAAA